MTPLGDVAGRLGLSVRQITYWAKASYVPIEPVGSGRVQMVTDEAYEQLRFMVQLHDAGFTVKAAARIAHKLRADRGDPGGMKHFPMYPGWETYAFLPLSEHVTISIRESA